MVKLEREVQQEVEMSVPMNELVRAERYDSWYDSSLGKYCLEAELALLRRGTGDFRYDSVLEIGCGTGRFLSALASNASIAVGVDLDRSMLEIARKSAARHAMRFVWLQGDATSVPLQSNAFDLVFASTLLCLQRDPRPILDEMLRICRPGGMVVVGELNPHAPWQLWRRLKAGFGGGYFRGAHWHPRRELMGMVKEGGCTPHVVGQAVFSVPFKFASLVRLNRTIDAVGRRLWPFLGAYYVVAWEK